jgi:UDP-2-acetamido-3-amino-2,3-dideoxy-glucuronate N-acetyltransferase
MSTKIESTAIVEPGAIIGEDCYIGHFAVIRPGAVIGDRSHVRAHCFIAAEAIIGNDTQIMQFSNICRNCVVGDEVFVGMGCMTTNTKKIAYKRDYIDINEPPLIMRAARIGARVTILPGVKIGENSVIGAGSLITKDTDPEYVYIGNPARRIKIVPMEELI